MGFIVKIDELVDAGRLLPSTTEAWDSQLSDVAAAVEAIRDQSSFKGEAATSVKSYLADVNLVANKAMRELLRELNTRFLLYKDGYLDIDPETHARIDEVKLEELYRFHGNVSSDFARTHYRLKRFAGSISDIMNVEIANPDPIQNDFARARANLKKLNVDVNAYEKCHRANDFRNFEKIKETLTSFLDKNAFSGGRMTEYTPGQVTTTAVYAELMASVDAAAFDRKAMVAEIENAMLREMQMLIADKTLTRGERLLAMLHLVTGQFENTALDKLMNHTQAGALISRVASFEYDPRLGYFVTNQTGIQGILGFSNAFEYKVAQAVLGMRIKWECISFTTSDGREWDYRMWLGGYGFGNGFGCEGAYYVYDPNAPKGSFEAIFKSLVAMGTGIGLKSDDWKQNTKPKDQGTMTIRLYDRNTGELILVNDSYGENDNWNLTIRMDSFQQQSGKLGLNVEPYSRDNMYMSVTIEDMSFDAKKYKPGDEMNNYNSPLLIEINRIVKEESTRGIKDVEQHIEYDRNGKPVNYITLTWDGEGQKDGWKS